MRTITSLNSFKFLSQETVNVFFETSQEFIYPFTSKLSSKTSKKR